MHASVMITGGGGAGTVSLLNYFESQGYRVLIGDADADAIDPRIPSEKRILLPYGTDKNFSDVMKQICLDYSIDFLIPGVDEELFSLSKYAEINRNFVCYLPTVNTVEVCLDKLATYEVLKAHGLPVPVTSTATVKPKNSECPLIVKPRSGRGSRGVVVISVPEQVAGYLLLNQADPDKIIIQEFLQGREYTVFVAASHQGLLQMVVPLRVLKKRGITIDAIVDYNPIVIDYCKRIADAIKPHGPINVQLILGDDDVCRAFEINPRVSTTFLVSLINGFDPVIQFRSTNRIPASLSPPEGTRLRRSWENLVHVGADQPWRTM